MGKRIEQIRKSVVIKNGIWLYLLQFFNTILPLLTLPYVTRIIGAEYYGVFSASFNIIAYLQVIVEYGFGMSATREVAVCKDDKKKVNNLFNAVIMARLFLLCISFTILIIISFLNKDSVKMACTIILFSCLVGYCIQQNWLYQGMQEMKYISLINIVARTVSTLLIFTFVKSREDIYIYCFLYAVSPILSGILGLIIACKRYKLFFIRPAFKDIISNLRKGWYVFTTQFSAKILNVVGITFLDIFTTNYEVGIFSAISKLPHMIVLLWSPISQVLYPLSSKKLSDSFDDGLLFVGKCRKVFLWIFGIGVSLAICLSRFLVYIAFGNEYVPYYYIAVPQFVFVLVAINNNFWGCQIMLGGGYDKKYSRCFQISVIATVLINLVLIYLWGINGASFCNLISESFLSVLLYFSLRKIKHERSFRML